MQFLLLSINMEEKSSSWLIFIFFEVFRKINYSEFWECYKYYYINLLISFFFNYNKNNYFSQINKFSCAIILDIAKMVLHKWCALQGSAFCTLEAKGTCGWAQNMPLNYLHTIKILVIFWNLHITCPILKSYHYQLLLSNYSSLSRKN